MTPPTSGVVTQRVQAAGMRAIEAYARLRRVAQRLGEELDEITSPNGVPTTELSEEDSLVIAVDKVLATAKR